MMFYYRHSKTGSVVKTMSELRGGFWERIPDPSEPVKVEEKPEKKTTKRKKGGETA